MIEFAPYPTDWVYLASAVSADVFKVCLFLRPKDGRNIQNPPSTVSRLETLPDATKKEYPSSQEAIEILRLQSHGDGSKPYPPGEHQNSW